MLLRTILLILAVAPIAALAEGGIQGAPPWPNQTGPELVQNGGLESLSDWSVGACAQAAAGVGVDGSAAVAISGDCRALSQARIAMPDPDVHPWVEVTMHVRKSSSATGELAVSFRDLTHGGYFAPAASAFSTVLAGTGAVTEGTVVPGGDFIEVYRLLAVNGRHSGENWRLDIDSKGVTSGLIYVDQISVRPAWYPLYNFVKYPSFHGYLWSGHDSTLCPSEAADEACGFVDVVPPEGESFGTVQIAVRLDSELGCATPDRTATILPSGKRNYWRLDASHMADDDSGYICAQLLRRQDGKVLADYPDWKIVKRTPAWRAANLKHWIDDHGRWRDGESPRFLWMTFQRFSGANCSNCVWDEARGGRQAYLNIRGFNLPNRRGAWRPVEGQAPPGSVWYDFLRSGRNVSLYFSPFSGASPLEQSDQVTPWLDALGELGLKYLHITNQYQGSLLGGDGVEDGDEAPSAPSVSCQPGAGAIPGPYVHVKISAVSGSNGLINNTRLEESQPSVSTAAVLPSNSRAACVVTPPVCSAQEIGFWVYAKASGIAAAPPDQEFSLQSTRFIPCGQSAELHRIVASGKAPLASIFGTAAGRSSRNRPWWMSKDASDLDALEQVAERSLGRDELLGYYICDECTAYDIGRNFHQVRYLREKDPGRLLMSLPLEVQSLAGVDWFFSPVVDVNAQDLYYEGQNLSDDIWAQGSSKGRSTSCYSFEGGNTLREVPNANLNKVDQWVDDKMRSHDGSRFNLPVVMQWARNSKSCFGWTYAEMRKQLWKAVIGVQNWGIVGGVGTWGWVSGSGLDRMARFPDDIAPGAKAPPGNPVGNTQALEDDIRAGQELMAAEPMLLAPIDDSTQRGFGKVLRSQPQSSLTLPTTTCTGYLDPVRAVAKQLPEGRQWILATNLCQDSQTIKFRLANPPEDAVVRDYFTGADLALTNGEFSVESTDFDVHAFVVMSRSLAEPASARRNRQLRE